MLDFTTFNRHLASIDDGGIIRSLKDVVMTISQVRSILSHTPTEYSSDYAKVRMISYSNGVAVDDTPASNQSIPASVLSDKLSQLVSLRTKVLSEARLLSRDVNIHVNDSLTLAAPKVNYAQVAGGLALTNTKLGSLISGASMNPVMAQWSTSTGGSWKGIAAWVGVKPTIPSTAGYFLDPTSPLLILLTETRDFSIRMGLVLVNDPYTLDPASWTGYVFRVSSSFADLLGSTLRIAPSVVGNTITYSFSLASTAITDELSFNFMAPALKNAGGWINIDDALNALPNDVRNLLTIGSNEVLQPQVQIWYEGIESGFRYPDADYSVDMLSYVQYLLDIAHVDDLIADLSALLS